MSRSFNGTSDYIEHGAAVVSAVPMTMACWFWVDPPAATGLLMYIGDSAAVTRVQLFLSSTALIAQTVDVASANATASVTFTGATRTGWNLGVAVFASSSDRRAYWNTIKVTNATTIVLGTPTATVLGARYGTGTLQSFFDGRIAEAAIWNVALDDADVCLLSCGYYPDQIRRGNLKAYWDLAGQYSPNEIDRVGRFDGVVNGAKPAIADHPPMLPRLRRHRAISIAYAFMSGPGFQFARPDSDITPGDWTPSSGGDLFAMVDEVTANDSDRIRSGTGAGDDAVTLGLSDITTPEAGDVSITIRHRIGT